MLTQKNGFKALGNMIRVFIPDPNFYQSRIPDPRVKKAPIPGSRSATLHGSANLLTDVEITSFQIPFFERNTKDVIFY
jgi:hypothetical protein